MRPESGLLGLRKALGTFANLRPGQHPPCPARRLDAACRSARRCRPDVRARTHRRHLLRREDPHADRATDLCTYTVAEVERVTRVACRLARGRRGKVTSIDKVECAGDLAPVARSVRAGGNARSFPDIQLEHMLVDAAAMHLIRRPRDFDVLLTENMFGDILTDEASMLAGSLGLLPSASLGDGSRGLYEPIHGSAPDIAGQGIANPYGTHHERGAAVAAFAEAAGGGRAGRKSRGAGHQRRRLDARHRCARQPRVEHARSGRAGRGEPAGS